MFEKIINYIFGRRRVIPINERPLSSYNTDNESPQYKPPSGPLPKIQEESSDGKRKRSQKKKRSKKRSKRT